MNKLQQQAANPEYSVWVSASAGTGKTKILTDRVLRLLISGTSVEKILCLTFTNAAAFEMQSRIRSKLLHFASITPESLIKELRLLLAKEPLANEIQSAKTLYHQLLHSNQGINIYTIHAFCQKLLKLFSFEAGINPEFDILDDITAAGIAQRIKNQIYLEPEYNQLMNFFLTNFHEITINDILLEIIQQKMKFRKLLAKRAYNITEYQDIVNSGEFGASAFLSCNSSLPQELSVKIRNLFTKYSLSIDSNQDIMQFFLTKDLVKRKNILPKSIATKQPDLLKALEYLQEEVFKVDQQRKMQAMEHYSQALTLLAKIFLDKYDNYKTKHNLLDYDDLIYHTQLLLNNKDLKSWILYKLDGWISHLLVDEAQDTSEEQWQIITTIIADFCTPTKHDNSIFVVGDQKQSIFSFQGANLNCFASVNQNLQQNFSRSNRNFKNITLEWSYRSTAAILDIVYITLEQIKNATPQLFPAENPKILPFRTGDKGKVEIWPLVKAEATNKLFWPLPNPNKAETAKAVIADQIASFIKQQILSKRILPTTKAAVKESDFMILVRKRDELVSEIINSLKKYNVQVEDIDRVTLNNNLSVLDLMSIAKFVLLPQDDLNLASLLKSPIIGINETTLQSLAIERGARSIWETLSTLPLYAAIYEKLCHFIQIYKTTHCGNFFSLIVDCFNIRKTLVANNGFDSNDLINELIYLSFNYANNVNSLLQSFVYWFENNTIEVKRNLEASSKIRIMTVHAAKGLQAPIVILCDTTSLPVSNNKFIWDHNDGLYATTKTSNSPEFFKALKEQQQLKDMQEYIRLLYVAMTRAEDHLIICGFQLSNTIPQNCWYELVLRAMKIQGKSYEDNRPLAQLTSSKQSEEDKEHKTTAHPGLAECRERSNIIVYGSSAEIEHTCDLNIISAAKQITFEPATVVEKSKQAGCFFDPLLLNKILKPTKQNFPFTSPLLPIKHLEYGKIFHKILEDAAKINNFSQASKHPYINNLPLPLQEKILHNLEKLLNNPEFMTLASQELKTEVTIGINFNGEIKIGRIDLLAISNGKVTIIDYKTDALPPKRAGLINEAYIDQLNFYHHLVEKLYPDKEITCKILWLEDGSLMNIAR